MFDLRPIGFIDSALTDVSDAPRQGDEGAPDAWLVFDEAVVDALTGLAVGDRVVVLTWLDRANRDTLTTHPRDDASQPETGVFATRSPHRPNPIGLHKATVLEISGSRVRVDQMEAVDGTPILDLKPVLTRRENR